MDKIFERWRIEEVENEIINYLDNGKKVFIENGCLNDKIISYFINNRFKKREVIFVTTASVFPLNIDFQESDYNIDTEDYEGNLFVEIS